MENASKTKTILIGTYGSKCLACGLPAHFMDAEHLSIPGSSLPGCGTKFENVEAISFENEKSFKEIVGKLRPDLKMKT
jgi:hypothetical protein